MSKFIVYAENLIRPNAKPALFASQENTDCVLAMILKTEFASSARCLAAKLSTFLKNVQLTQI